MKPELGEDDESNHGMIMFVLDPKEVLVETWVSYNDQKYLKIF